VFTVSCGHIFEMNSLCWLAENNIVIRDLYLLV